MSAKTKTIPRDPAWPAWAKWYTTDEDGTFLWEWEPRLDALGAYIGDGRTYFVRCGPCGPREASIARIVDPKPPPKRKAKRKAVSRLMWGVVQSGKIQIALRSRSLTRWYLGRVIRVRVEEVGG